MKQLGNAGRRPRSLPPLEADALVGADHGVPAVERRIGVREIAPLVGPPALLARKRGGGDQPRQRVGVAREAPAASRRRGEARRGATARSGSAPWGVRGGAPDRRRGDRPAAARRWPRGRRAGRGRSTPPGSSTPGGWPRAGRCRHTRPPRAARRRRRARRGRWPHPPSCSARRAPRGPGRGRGRCPPRPGPRRCSGSAPCPPGACRATTEGRPLRRSSASIARATSSRGASSSTKRSPAASWSVAPSPRTASVTRNPSRTPSATRAVGWNWTNSRSARSAPAACARARPTPTDPSGLVVRDHSAAAPPVASTVPRDTICAGPRSDATPTPTQRPSWRSEGGGRGLLEHLDTGVGGDQGGEIAGDPPARRGASRVRDPPRGVPSLQPEGERAVAVGVEVHAELLELPDPVGRVLAQRLDRARPGGAAARDQRVLGVTFHGVPGGESRGDPALGPVARRARQLRARDERDTCALARGHQGAEQARRARPDHGHVGAQRCRCGAVHGGSRVP